MSIRSRLLFGLAIVAICTGGKAWGSICPTTSNTNTDCGYILTIGPGGSVTGAAVANANPYDGSDDALVGIINNSGSAFTGSIFLSGSGNGGGIFGFDGDGICTFTAASYCSGGMATTGYEGPDNTFSNISSDQTSGDVDVMNLADGGTTYFSLESSPGSIAAGGGIGVPGVTPEPGSLILLGSGILGIAGVVRRRLRF